MSKFTIEIKLQEPQKKEPAQPGCPCRRCDDETARHVGRILLSLVCDEYTPRQAEHAVDILGAMLRRYYTKSANRRV